MFFRIVQADIPRPRIRHQRCCSKYCFIVEFCLLFHKLSLFVSVLPVWTSICHWLRRCYLPFVWHPCWSRVGYVLTWQHYLRYHQCCVLQVWPIVVCWLRRFQRKQLIKGTFINFAFLFSVTFGIQWDKNAPVFWQDTTTESLAWA